MGPYRILERVGVGGMGEVYLAEQTAPIRRRVALKLVRPGLDTGEVLARFQAERQALALMDHPAIARVYEAGSASDGRPYFAMEYAPGEPITGYCDRNRLGTSARLALFVRVCEGVQHAHQKGIVHRDLKPSNVLVTVQGDTPVPKIIDFGVAKAIGPRLTDRTVHTMLGAMVGTPAYMSPEQADPGGHDVDTRADVYSLGVMLYEILTGVLPFESDQLLQDGYAGMIRKIRDDDPPRPSIRLTTLPVDRTHETAKRRRTDPRGLKRELVGDLDWITMRALEKDRARRYPSASELAADLVRHLEHEPVSAGPPGAGYRIAKFVRRHRLAVIAAGLVIAALLAGIAGTTAGMVRAKQAQEQIRLEADTARRVSEFLIGLFGEADPELVRGETVTAREILDRGAERIRADLDEDPVMRARMLVVLGRVYHNLGLLDTARPLLEDALEIRRATLGPDDLAVAESLHMLGWLLQSKGEYREAVDLHERAAAIRLSSLPSGHVDRSWSRYYLGSSLAMTGDTERAKSLLERAAVGFEHKLGPTHQAVAWVYNDLGQLARAAGDDDTALEMWTRALAIKRAALPPDHPDIAKALDNLASVHGALGNSDRALALFEEGLRIHRKVHGPAHPNVALSESNLALLLARVGRRGEAQVRFDRSILVLRESWGEDHLATLYQRACYAALTGDTDAALAALRRMDELGILVPAVGTDPDLEPLHGHPEFEEMVARATPRHEAPGSSRPEER